MSKTKVVKVSLDAWLWFSKRKLDWGLRRKETIVDALLDLVQNDAVLLDRVRSYCKEAE